MKFRKRIFWVFTIYALLITMIAGGIYGFICIRQHREKVGAELEKQVNIAAGQLEQQILQMDAVTNSILSDSEVLTALRILSGTVPAYQEEDKKWARGIMNIRLYSDYLMSNFYRVLFCNQSGEVISTRPLDKPSYEREELQDISWMEEASTRKRGFLLVKSHGDDWYQKKGIQVISLVRKLQGTGLGYLEVQKRTEDLGKLFQLDRGRYTIYIHNQNGTVLYTDSADNEGTLPVDFGKDAHVTRCAQRAGASVTIVDHTDWMAQGIREMIPGAFLIILSVAGISCIYVFLASQYVSRPIQVLGEYMKNTELKSMDEELTRKLPNDEIDMLYREYRDVLKRLEKSMKKERQLSLLQLQAQFDLLQAQVNPHFLYNVLNVISSRGMEVDDEAICDICDDLAWMLRYATNNQERYAVVNEEVQYLERYFHLLKYRYEDKLTYEISVPSQLKQQILPKIILQQIAENSIAHGYENVNKNMELCVLGKQSDDGWYIEIRDNGAGIDEEGKKKIAEQFIHIRRQLTVDRENLELKLGGMGLKNLYARLYLIYQEDMIFEIESDEKGTTVRIGERCSHVSGIGS